MPETTFHTTFSTSHFLLSRAKNGSGSGLRSAVSYRFGFNGKENDNEIKGDGNSVDFGARIYDSRLGRWMSVDPYFRKFPSESPFIFAGNNPINNIDIDGKYKFPTEKAEKNAQQNYPTFYKYLKENVENDVMNSATILHGLEKYSGGNLTPDEVKKAVHWGSGPAIIITDAPGGFKSDLAFGHYNGPDDNTKPNTIELNSSMLDFLEKAEDKEAALLIVFSTLMHETTHYGDYLDRKQTEGEVGNDFEENVFETALRNTKAMKQEAGDTWVWDKEKSEENSRKAIDEFKNDENKEDIVPTLPSN